MEFGYALVYRVLILLLPMAFVIGIIDYLVMSKWTRCEKCGQELPWYSWILPSLLEFLMFGSGVAVGMIVVLGK